MITGKTWSETPKHSEGVEQVATVLTIFEEFLRGFEGRVGARKCELLREQ